MKKILVVFLALLLVCGSAFASVGVQQSSTYIGQATDINCNTGITCNINGSIAEVMANGNSISGGTATGVTINNSAIGGTTRAAGAFTTLAANGATTLTNTLTVSGTTTLNGAVTIASSGNVSVSSMNASGATVVVLPVVASTSRPASGATAGSIVMLSNSNDSAPNCGTAGSGGTTFVVCVSDGTNWKMVKPA